MTKWVKDPAPGQFRGEGTWKTLEQAGIDEEMWEHYRKTQFLPTHEGEEPPICDPDETPMLSDIIAETGERRFPDGQ